MITIIVYKVALTLLLIVIRMTAGLFPILITVNLKKWAKTDNHHQKWVDQSLSIISSVGGGALLATCFIHMIPEIRECLEDILPSITFIQKDLAYAELLVCIGFFLAYFIEELVHYYLSLKKNSLPKQLRSDSPVQWAIKTNNWFDKMDQESHHPHPQQHSPKPNAHSLSVPAEPEVCNDASSESEACTRCNSIGKPQSAVVNHLTHNFDQRKKSVLVVLALSFHSVFEGIAIGLERNLEDVRYLFAAVALHESTILFCIGLEMIASGSTFSAILLHVTALALVSPLGVVIGTLLTLNQQNMDSYSQRIMIGTLQGLAAGTILYVTFFEMLDKQRNQETGLARVAFIFCGFIIMLCLSVRGSHSHSKPDNIFLGPCNSSSESETSIPGER